MRRERWEDDQNSEELGHWASWASRASREKEEKEKREGDMFSSEDRMGGYEGEG